MKKSKRSQKKRKRLSGGSPKGQQRQPRPILSDEDYPQPPVFDPTAGEARVPQPGRGGAAQQPRRNPAGSSQRPAQRGQQANSGRPQRQSQQAGPPRRGLGPNPQQHEVAGGHGRPQRQVRPPGGSSQVPPNEMPQQDSGYSEGPQPIEGSQQNPGAGSFRAMSRTGAGKRRASGTRPASSNASNPMAAQPTTPSNQPNRVQAQGEQPSTAPSRVGEHTQAFQRVNPLRERDPVPGQTPAIDRVSQEPLPTRPTSLPGAVAPHAPAVSNRPQDVARRSRPTPAPAPPNIHGPNSGSQPIVGDRPPAHSADISGSNTSAARRTSQEANRLAAEAAAPAAIRNVQPPVSLPDASTRGTIQLPSSLDEDTGPPTEAFDVSALSDDPSGQAPAATVVEAKTFSPEIAKPMDPAVEPGVERRPKQGTDLAHRPKTDALETGGRGKKVKKPLPQSTSRKAPKKPSEPTKTLLAVALSAIVLVGLGVAILMFARGGGDDTEAVGVDDQVASGDEETPTEEEVASETSDPTASQDGTFFVNVANDAAALGPLQAGTEYEMLVEGANSGASFRYLVDGVPVGESFTGAAPALSLEPGRQVISLEQTLEGEVTVGSGVAVYVLGETPGRSYRANLKSVNLETEGWAEAVKQFDLLKEIHPELKLAPSDPYPSLTPGYWNLYIDGFDSSDAANAYCEGKGLAVPDACFSKLFDPGAPAS